jgi:hypothetical protein
MVVDVRSLREWVWAMARRGRPARYAAWQSTG